MKNAGITKENLKEIIEKLKVNKIKINQNI